MRAAATRRARKGTVSRPTIKARNNAVTAKMAVAMELPRSRATDENTAAVNANPSPATAIKNRCHASRSTLDHIDFRYSRICCLVSGHYSGTGFSLAQFGKIRIVPKVLQKTVPNRMQRSYAPQNQAPAG